MAPVRRYEVTGPDGPDYVTYGYRIYACEDCAGAYSVSWTYSQLSGKSTVRLHPMHTSKRPCMCRSRFDVLNPNALGGDTARGDNDPDNGESGQADNGDG